MPKSYLEYSIRELEQDEEMSIAFLAFVTVKFRSSKEITMIDYGLTNDMSRFVTEIQIPRNGNLD